MRDAAASLELAVDSAVELWIHSVAERLPVRGLDGKTWVVGSLHRTVVGVGMTFLQIERIGDIVAWTVGIAASEGDILAGLTRKVIVVAHKLLREPAFHMIGQAVAGRVREEDFHRRGIALAVGRSLADQAAVAAIYQDGSSL